jgi:hypothetical protein
MTTENTFLSDVVRRDYISVLFRQESEIILQNPLYVKEKVSEVVQLRSDV